MGVPNGFPQRKYTPEQLTAIYAANLERGISYPKIAAQAVAGELIEGQPFTIGARYVGRLVQAERKRRVGKGPSALAALPATDAVEHMRTRMLALWEGRDTWLNSVSPAKQSAKDLQDQARLAVDIARIPGPKDARPEKSEDSHTAGQPREPAMPKGGEVGALLASFRTQANGTDDPGE